MSIIELVLIFSAALLRAAFPSFLTLSFLSNETSYPILTEPRIVINGSTIVINGFYPCQFFQSSFKKV